MVSGLQFQLGLAQLTLTQYSFSQWLGSIAWTNDDLVHQLLTVSWVHTMHSYAICYVILNYVLLFCRFWRGLSFWWFLCDVKWQCLHVTDIFVESAGIPFPLGQLSYMKVLTSMSLSFTASTTSGDSSMVRRPWSRSVLVPSDWFGDGGNRCFGV